jgi:hypothetical protein
MPPAKKTTRKRAAKKKAPAKKRAARRGPKTMTAAHKSALAKGREESRAVSAYLEWLENHRPRRGRRRTPAGVEKELSSINDSLKLAKGTSRVSLIQRRLNLQAELAAFDRVEDPSKVIAGFVKHAKAFGSRKGISRAAWREAGVPADVLKQAGV